MSGSHSSRIPCPLLQVPPEIRLHIYNLLLPCTVNAKSLGKNHEAAWLPGNTAVLATNRQIHREAAAVLYGQNDFLVGVNYESVLFRFRRLLKSGLVPQGNPALLDVLSTSNLRSLKNLSVTILHDDSYTGMIKYNFSGPGLTEGLRHQVKKLVEALLECDELISVRVTLVDCSCDPEKARRVLEPLLSLRVVERGVELIGCDDPGFVDAVAEATWAKLNV